VAVSKKRKTSAYKVPRNLTKPPTENPRWLGPTIVTLLIFAVLWIVTYYILGRDFPLHLGYWNVMIGFGAMMVALGLLTRLK